MLARTSIDCHPNLLPRHIQIHSDHFPGISQAQQSLIQFDVAYSLGFPFQTLNMAKEQLITHIISRFWYFPSPPALFLSRCLPSVGWNCAWMATRRGPSMCP